jgi:protein CMS1
MSMNNEREKPQMEDIPIRPGMAFTKRPRKRKLGADLNQISKKVKDNNSRSKNGNVTNEELDFTAGINRALARMDNQLLADHIAQRTRRFESDLSSVELEDKHIPGMIYSEDSPSMHFI